jgi:hypothetical protein
VDPGAPTSTPVLPGRVLAAAFVVLGATLLALRSPPASWERTVAGVVCDVPSAFTGVLEAPMQAGSRAAIAAALATILVLGLRLKSLPAAVVAAVAVLTAVARVHLGAHWPLDVVGGAALGAAAGAVGVALVERVAR